MAAVAILKNKHLTYEVMPAFCKVLWDVFPATSWLRDRRFQVLQHGSSNEFKTQAMQIAPDTFVFEITNNFEKTSFSETKWETCERKRVCVGTEVNINGNWTNEAPNFIFQFFFIENIQPQIHQKLAEEDTNSKESILRKYARELSSEGGIFSSFWLFFLGSQQWCSEQQKNHAA